MKTLCLRLFAVSCILFNYFIAFAQLPSYLPANGLVAWYPFNGNANDENKNGHNGQAQGATLTSDRFGNSNKAYSFNGNLDNITTSLQQTNINSYTVSAWFKTNHGGWILTGRQENSGDHSIRMLVNIDGVTAGGYGVLYGTDGDGNTDLTTTVANYNDNQWHHAVGVWDGSNSSVVSQFQMKLYIDGTFVPQTPGTSVGNGGYGGHPNIPISGNSVCRFGISPGNYAPQSLVGQLDDIAIYNRALTEAEIQGLYTAQPNAVTNSCSLPSSLQQGIVGYWPFCGNANDESGNGNNGVVNGAIMVSDRFGSTNSAYQFNNNFIRIPYNANLSPTSGSVSIWLKVNGLFNQGQQLLFAQSEGRPSTYVNSQFRCGQLKSAGNSWRTTSSGGTSDYATVCGETILDDGQWHHIVGTYTPSSLKIYVDGILESSTTTSLIQNPSIFKDFYIGGFGPADGGFQYFNGTLDDLIVYNRALTATEVSALYTATATNTGGGTTNTTPAPPGIPYQAEVRNDSGEVLANANVNVRFTLHELTANGTVSYQETHAITTNELGLFAATIGAGTPTQGTFAAINWAQTTKFMQVEVDAGNGYINMGNQQLLSIPYALYSQKARMLETQGMPVYETNAQALAGGLQAGDLYRTSLGDLKVVY